MTKGAGFIHIPVINKEYSHGKEKAESEKIQEKNTILKPGSMAPHKFKVISRAKV
jgi:hypothetical protein